MAIPFIDLPLQHSHFRAQFLERVGEVLDSGQFILGKPVKDFEEAFAEFLGCEYAVGVNSGTDALLFALKALEIGPGHEVICPGFGFIATVDVILRTGATPVLVDIDPATYCINSEKIAEAITDKTKAIIPVHLFGRACDMSRIMEIANARGIAVIEDACQACGTMVDDNFCGAIGKCGAFSFYPTKNLGGIGDGGMLTTNDEAIYQKALLLRDHGRNRMNGSFDIIGYNSRLDTIQAVYLDMKIEDLEESNVDRVENARLYEKLFQGSEVRTPEFLDDGSHTYNLYTIQVRDRDRLQNFLKENEIGSAVYYQRGLHREPALEKLGLTRGPLPVTDDVSRKVLSLPCFPAMKRGDVERVAAVVLEFLDRNESFERRRR